MTAFGRGEAPLGSDLIVAEVRTVNSRHLDLRVRLPREYSELEPPVRAAASTHFSRGKVDVNVRLPEGSTPPEVAVEIDVAARYVEAADALRKRFEIEGELSLAALLALPGVVRLREPERPGEALAEAIQAAVEGACRAAAEMRAREGNSLKTELSHRLGRIEEGITRIESRADEVQKGLRERLERRIAALAPEVGLDPSRLDQEVVFYVDRSDVTEETVRFRSHIAQFREAIETAGPVGRKLEFLLQELAREANTLGAKAADGELAGWGVELKTELEKLREQVLNVE
jgi:uncharacterized protein (TIGR00255 family)